MATRGRDGRSQKSKRQKAGGSESKADSSGQKTKGSKGTAEPSTPPTPTSTPAPTAGDKDLPSIRKGVYLSALIYVEGDQPAPEDFTAPATDALKEALGKALKATPDGMNMTLKSVEVRNDVEQDEEGGKEEKFQF